jgi:membrane-associated PAP2 superfamily phosphatase
MPPISNHNTSMRAATPLKRLFLFTSLSLLAVLAWDFSGLDMRLMHALADPPGFPLQHNWWLEYLLHDKARQLALLIYAGVFAMVWLPVGPFKRLRRVQRFEIWLGITLGLLLINWVKRYSLTSCPWELTDFGGMGTYVSHWNWLLSDGGSGHCFPGGHASSAFAFAALTLPWLMSSSKKDRLFGVRMLSGILLLGFFLGGVQTLRGAHYPSHTLWTGFLCWSVSVANHLGFSWCERTKKRTTHTTN